MIELNELDLEFEESADTRWITGTVALLSIVVFVVSGSQLLPAALGVGEPPIASRSGLTTAFLLNIALLLFAWRRSKQLRTTFAERDSARREALGWAFVDDVTGLYNRRYYNQRVQRLIDNGTRPLALILIDLDRFKQVNDLFGHDAGDEVLAAVGRIIRELTPAGAMPMRIGGDEFAVVMPGCEAAGRPAQRLAADLVARLAEPIGLSSITAVIGASVGVADLDDNCRDPSDLLRRSDLAMYEAKRRGRSQWVRFDSGLEHELRRRNTSEEAIRAAIAADAFVPYFQPVVELASGAPVAFEVLARWPQPDGRVLEPAEFISGAESAGVIAELSLGVLRKALEAAAAWPQDCRIAVNISPLQFRDPLLAQKILKVLRQTGFPAARLELEITESSLIGDPAQAGTTIESLRNCGCTIAIDDFGVGYASLAQLRAFSFDRIKIDRGFVADMLQDACAEAIVHSVIMLAGRLGIPTTAEGVETEAARWRLRELGCTEAQGWLFAKALSAEDVGHSVYGRIEHGPAAKAAAAG